MTTGYEAKLTKLEVLLLKKVLSARGGVANREGEVLVRVNEKELHDARHVVELLARGVEERG